MDYEKLFCDQLDQAFRTIGPGVMALYRETLLGSYVPITWKSLSQDAPAPAVVAPASDLAEGLRRASEGIFVMHINTFRDDAVRHALEEHHATSLVAVEIPTKTASKFFLTAGFDTGFVDQGLVEKIEALGPEFAPIIDGVVECGKARNRSTSPLEVEASPDTPLRLGVSKAMALLARGADVKAIASALQELLGHTVILESAAGAFVAGSDLQHHDTTINQMSSLGNLGAIELLETRSTPVDIELTDGSSRMIMAIRSGGKILGFLSILDMPAAALNSDELAIATLFAAYAFEKKRASRGELVRRSLNSQEAERVRIASEIHNDASQNLVALKVHISTALMAHEHGRDEDMMALIEDCERIADDVLEGVNRLAAELRPSELDYLGLYPALKAFATERLSKAHIDCVFDGNALNASFDPLCEVSLLRIAQEAISNCVRYSLADSVRITFESDGTWFTMTIADDGIGFNGASVAAMVARGKSCGIMSMRDHAELVGGELWIGSADGMGTSVIARIPEHFGEE